MAQRMSRFLKAVDVDERLALAMAEPFPEQGRCPVG